MKKTYTLFFVLFLSLILSSAGLAQNLFTEDFDYPAGTFVNGSIYGQGGWTGFSSTANLVQVTTPGLTFDCYPRTLGNAVTLGSTGQDLSHKFSASVTTGSVYASAVVKVTAVGTTVGDYFLNLGTGTTTFTGKLFARANATSGFDFGISKLGNATTTTAAVPVWTSSPGYAINSTHLVVLQYKWNAGTTTDDSVFLYIDPPNTCQTCALPYSSLKLVTTDGNIGADAVKIDSIYLRQGGGAQAPTVIVDGIEVNYSVSSTANCDVNLPLPVELNSFTSTMNGRNVQLRWETKTEKNSNQFIIEKMSNDATGSSWITVGSVKASVLSNSPKQYSYTDRNLQAGTYQYRLKMIDNDGSFIYSASTEISITAPKNFELSQNYPNPFNPSTRIDYQLPVNANVVLAIYSITGQKVAELVNQNQAAGFYSVDFGSSSIKLSSGIYVYRLTAGDNVTGNNFTSMKKMMLLK